MVTLHMSEKSSNRTINPIKQTNKPIYTINLFFLVHFTSMIYVTNRTIYTIIKRNTSSFYPPLQPVERKCKRAIILKLDEILCLYIYYFLHFTRPQAKVVT